MVASLPLYLPLPKKKSLVQQKYYKGLQSLLMRVKSKLKKKLQIEPSSPHLFLSLKHLS